MPQGASDNAKLTDCVKRGKTRMTQSVNFSFASDQLKGYPSYFRYSDESCFTKLSNQILFQSIAETRS